MTKQQRIQEYNQVNTNYNITGVKKLPKDHLQWSRVNSPKSLDELYNSYSDAKRQSWSDILRDYRPKEVIGLQGSSMAYSVYLVAENNDTLWITRDNNYLVEVQ